MSKDKPKKLLVIGATSFVGRRFCRNLIEREYHSQLSITFSARNENKFKELFPDSSLPKSINFSKLDTYDSKDVHELVSKHNIVCNFAGPFSKYGKNVVEACAKYGVHYLDITGEINFIKEMIIKHEDTAKTSGASLIPFCGFDSVPSDLGVFLIKEKINKLHSSPLKSAHIIYRVKGGINGGTIASAFEAISDIPNEEISNLHYLCPNERTFFPPLEGNKRKNLKGINVGPFFMEQINNKIVYRTKHLREHQGYAKNFLYQESMFISDNFSFLTSRILQISLDLTDALLKVKKLSKILRLALPKPGEGPSDDLIENGFFKAQVIGISETGETESITISADGDPGNKATVNLILLCLDSLLKTENPPSGFQTPMSCFGDKIIKNSQHFNIHIKDN